MSNQFLSLLERENGKNFVSNADVQFSSVKVNEARLPLTICDKWALPTCSTAVTTAHYVQYPLETYVDHPWIPYALKIAAPLFRWHRLNKAVYVNNWLFSTNLYPSLTHRDLKDILQQLCHRYPRHALVFSSITPEQDPELASWLRAEGCALVPRRPVYLTDTTESRPFKSRMFKSDLKILKSTPYTVRDHFTQEEAHRIQQLYIQLNCTKYSSLNPCYTSRFVWESHQLEALEWRILELDGQIDAALGFYEKNGVLTSPFFGYDTSKPEDLGLYRQIATLLALEAKERGLLLNHSGGAANFKKLRRARPTLEYIATYTAHLPLKERLSWKSLSLVVGESQFRKEF